MERRATGEFMTQRDGNLPPSKKTWAESAPRWFMAAIWTLAAALICLAAWSLRLSHRETRDGWKVRLSALASDRATAIEAYILGLQADARTISWDIAASYILSPPPTGGPTPLPEEETSEAHLKQHLRWAEQNFSCLTIYLLDIEGRMRVSSSDAPHFEARLTEALIESGWPRSEANPLFFIEQNGQDALAFFETVRAGAAGDGEPIGAVVLVMDPQVWLYPLIEREPLPTRTGEILLGWPRDGARGRKSPGTGPLVPSSSSQADSPLFHLGTDLPGGVGFGELKDCSGVTVLAASHPVSGTGWTLVAKVDKGEAFGPFYQRAAVTMGALLLLLAGLLVLHAALLRAQRAQSLAELKRAQSEMAWRWQSTFDVVNDAICLLDTDQTILHANHAMAALAGCAPETLTGRHCWEMVHGSAEPIPDCPVMRMKDSLREEATELRIGDRWFNAACYPTLDSQKGIVGAVHILKDITGRKQMEDELRRMALLLDVAPSCITVHGLDGRFLYANQRAIDMHGYNRAEFMALTIRELDVPESERLFESRIRELLERGEASFEVGHFRKDGTILPLETFASVTTWSGQKVILSLGTDLTERKQTEETLRRRDEQLKLFFEHPGIGMAITSLDKRWIMVNDALCRILGYSREELLSLRWTDLTHPDDIERDTARLNRLILGEMESYSFEKRYLHKDGHTVHAFLAVGCLRDESGKVVQILSVADDITERKRVEEEILRLNAELEARVLKRTAELEATNKELESFSYSVSHDLRAPLRAVSGFSDILKKDYSESLDAEGQRLLSIVVENVRHMGCLIDNLLAFSRMGRAQMKPSPVAMGPLVRAVWAELGGEREPGRIAFECMHLPDALGDQALLRQVWVNLLGNALKFTSKREAPLVEVGGRQERAETVYWVKDNGAGFDPAYGHKLFGVFQRLHRREDFPGTGVGLALVQRIIQRHGGRVWAEGEEGRGAKFWFSLPSPADGDGGEKA